MDLLKSAELARTLLNEHGYSDIKIAYTSSVSQLGCAVFKNKLPALLKLSRPYIEAVEANKVYELILHEIAHFKAGHNHGHDSMFRFQCFKLGLSSKAARASTTERVFEVKRQARNYVYICAGCGIEFNRARKIKNIWLYSCKKCKGDFKLK